MKTVIVNVENLTTHAEKYKVRQSFEALGWTTQIGFLNNKRSLVPKPIVRFYQFTWWESVKPVYPKIPDDCFMTDG